jgi:nitrogen fixation NifU-like protein
MMELSEIALDHFINPRNVGIAEDYNGYGKVGDPSCGDVCEITVRIERNTLEDIKFRVYGCAGAIATASAVTVIAAGMEIQDALKLTDGDVVEFLGGLPERKQHCSLLALQALRQAINDYLLVFRRAVKEGAIIKRSDYKIQRKKILQGMAKST